MNPPEPPVRVGDSIHIPVAVALPSGRAVRPGHYEVLAVRGPRVQVRCTPDCSALGRRFQAPSIEAWRDGARVPFSALSMRVWIEPGQYTAYDPVRTTGRKPITIPDR